MLKIEKVTDVPGFWLYYRKVSVRVQAVRIMEVFEVSTLEGKLTGKSGDYLLRGIRGELYPCDADIFHETYKELP